MTLPVENFLDEACVHLSEVCTYGHIGVQFEPDGRIMQILHGVGTERAGRSEARIQDLSAFLMSRSDILAAITMPVRDISFLRICPGYLMLSCGFSGPFLGARIMPHPETSTPEIQSILAPMVRGMRPHTDTIVWDASSRHARMHYMGQIPAVMRLVEIVSETHVHLPLRLFRVTNGAMLCDAVRPLGYVYL